ncbi:ras guanine nucleotide exchange factor domain-containing protein [Jimgerdemannia flammicorona]|uniref:Ras guanine nucleotide exchange factor domain-containing protein n=2 Tax=Jimgerdemannia flammicorona TaxID=994334 RepID=A0A433Q8W4_9FUNG|nr:ras guanine nucleotide exchange factor domain-containing protein [Jimgerdemannia flammicorona]RUS26248.1 ras guanine nucleotide exchange factor domain-containing protein [Jimgerdemannia flammicorona]
MFHYFDIHLIYVKCRNYSNFATLVQILLGLQSPSVSRLRKTWSRVGTLELKFLDELSAFTSPIKNWKHIRDNMTTVAEEYGMSPTEIQIEMPGTGTLRGIQDWVNPKAKIKIPFGGCIPFLGIFLSDLVFNSELPSYIESKVKQEQGELTRIYNIHASQTDDLSSVQSQPLVNFHKHRTTATVIKRVLIFQNLARRYPFKPKTDLHEYCDKLNSLDPDLVRKLSHYIEE